MSVLSGNELQEKMIQIEEAIEFGAFRPADLGREDAVYHYTKLDALKGIVENNVFWATEYNYLNDEQEFQYVQKVLMDVLERELGAMTPENPCAPFMGRLFECMAAETLNEYYVASFSLNSDNLTLWAEFANPGCNVKCNIFDLFDYEDYTVNAVIYDYEKQAGIVEEVLFEVMDFFFPDKKCAGLKEYLAGESVQVQQGVAGACAKLVAYRGMFMKSPLFQAEEEYRAVFKCVEDSKHKYRIAQNRFVPYIEIPLSEEGKHGMEEIMLAPLNRSELDIRSMGMFCQVNGLEHMKVRTSELKLRF